MKSKDVFPKDECKFCAFPITKLIWKQLQTAYCYIYICNIDRFPSSVCFYLKHQKSNDVSCHIGLEVPRLTQGDAVLINKKSMFRSFGGTCRWPCPNRTNTRCRFFYRDFDSILVISNKAYEPWNMPLIIAHIFFPFNALVVITLIN